MRRRSVCIRYAVIVLTSTLDVRTLHLAPAPLRHRCSATDVGTRLRVDHGEPRAPLEVRDEWGSDLGIARPADFVGALQQKLRPGGALLLRQCAASVPVDHVPMPAVLLAVRLRTAEHF